MKRMLFSMLFILGFLGVKAFPTANLVSTAEFMELLKTSKEMVVVDCDRPQNYATQHVKGAINIWQQDLFSGKPDGILKSPEELAQIFGAKGISEKAPIILYDDGSNKYTARLYFVLKMLGAQDVKIFSKNMQEWSKYRVPLTSQPTTLPKTTFNLNLNNDMLISIDVLKGKLNEGGFTLIDTRKLEEFAGQTDKSKGHLPGAIHIDYRDFLDTNNNFKNADELRAMPVISSLNPEQEIILYCNSGVLASVGYYALKEVLGFPKVKILNGGYNHWVLDENNPVVK
ncbi:MAG: sulfurtransferase [Bacteroidales bacterium]